MQLKQDMAGPGPWPYCARPATYQPRSSETCHNIPERARPPFAISTDPEASLSSTSLLDAGLIDAAASVGCLGLQAAYQARPLRVQAEYIRTEVGPAVGQPNLSFEGGYVEAGWVLNGRGRTYRLKPNYGTTYAVFGGLDVAEDQRIARDGIGVFELKAHLGALDLDDRAIRGEREWNATIGLNSYPDKNVKGMADHVWVQSNYPSTSALEGRRVDADIFIGRLQFYR